MKFYTIVTKDIGKKTIECFGHKWNVNYFMGNVLNTDVGKRIYLVNDTLYIENNEQFKSRVNKEIKDNG